MAESAELSSLFDDSCFKISVSEAVFPNYFRIKLNVRSLNMRQTQHCLHFSIALNVCQRHTDILSCELLCLDAPHGKPRHHHREYHGVSPQIIGR